MNTEQQEVRNAILELQNALGAIEFHTEKLNKTLATLKGLEEKAKENSLDGNEGYLIFKAESISSRYVSKLENEGKEEVSIFYELHDKYEDYLNASKLTEPSWKQYFN